MSLSRRKGFFHPRPYWRATCSKPGHYTGSLPTPMFAWHLRSRGSGTRQARCHQQMGRRYVANISVGSVPAWASECLSILRFTWLYERGCSELLPIFFFLNMCMLLFLFIPCKRGWLLSVNVLWLFHLSHCVVSVPAVQLDLTNSMSRNSPALGIDHTELHSKLTDENYWRWRGPSPAFVFW